MKALQYFIEEHTSKQTIDQNCYARKADLWYCRVLLQQQMRSVTLTITSTHHVQTNIETVKRKCWKQITEVRNEQGEDVTCKAH